MAIATDTSESGRTRFAGPRIGGWSISRVHPLVPILILALGLRLVAASLPSTHHPDEIFQYLEAAHRLVFGYGAITWEYRSGIRSWLFPLILAGPMALGNAIAPGGTLYLWLPKLLMVFLSLAPLWSAWRFGALLSRRHALVAAFVVATWGEFVYFAPHTLSEMAAIAAALPAAAMLFAKSTEPGRRTIAVAGMLLAFAVLIRFQFAPALAVFAVMFCGKRADRWIALVAGAAIVAVIGGIVDLAMGSTPYGWLIENIRQNLLQDRASQYGRLGPFGYVTWFEHLWSWWLLPIVPLVWIGMRRQPALFWAAIVNLVLHSLIGHKEYRFVEFSAVIFIPLAALGSVDVLGRVERGFPGLPRSAGTIALCIAWLIASASAAQTRAMRDNWARSSDTLMATAALRDDPEVCGIALFKTDLVNWGGYSYLHRPLPVTYFEAGDPAMRGAPAGVPLERWSPGFNRILTPADNAARLPPGFTKQQCVTPLGSQTPSFCIYARPGPCIDQWRSPFLLDRVLVRVDEQVRDNIRRGLRPLN